MNVAPPPAGLRLQSGGRSFLSGQIDHQYGEVAGGDAFEAAGLAEGLGAEFFEGLFGFLAEFGDGGEVEVGGDGFGFEVVEALGGFFFALDVAGVFGFDFDLGPDGVLSLES